MHLSIEVTPEQHRRLQAVAAARGQSLKDYVLERALPSTPEADFADGEQALHELETFLQPRLEEAELNLAVEQSVEQIFAEAHQQEELQ